MALRSSSVALAALFTLFSLAVSARASSAAEASGGTSADLAAARALFTANLDAIRHRDRAAYLACYLRSDSLARTGPTGFRLGYAELARDAGQGWPDHFDASDLKLVAVRDGLVYGTYRYRVRYGAVEQSGLSERLFMRTPEGWRIAVTTAFPTLDTPPPPKALVGATLIDGTGRPPVRDAVVVLRNGMIDCAGPRRACPVPAGVDTVNLRGLWITPGLVDAHVHHSQTGWADGRPDAIDLRERYPYEETQKRLREHPEVWHRSCLCSGVTSVFDVGGFPWTVALQEKTEHDTRAPHVAAAGPLLSTLDFWLNLPAERQFLYLKDEASAREEVRYLAALGSRAVKVWFIIAPNRDFDEMARIVSAAGDEARRLGLPLIVHATGLREAKAALEAGAKLLVHSVWDTTVDDEFLKLARERKTIYCPTLTVVDGYYRLFDSVRNGRAPAVDDPNRCVDSLTFARIASTPRVAAGKGPAGRGGDAATRAQRARVMATNLMRVHRAGIPIAMGTDAGNPLTLQGPSVHAEMEAMQRAGMTPLEVLEASTRGGAMAMGRLLDLGTVEAGKVADLLVVGADPTRDIASLRRVRYVVRGGEVRPIEELRVRR